MAVSALLLLGFSAGWLMFRPQKSEISRPGPTTVEEPSSPPAAEVAVPPEDVPGAGLPGLPRYPGSVRTDYKREQVGDLLVTEAEYLVTADLEPVREFYRDVFRDEDWSVGDLGFSRGEWVFFVIHGNREALVEIEERGEVVEIELELTEPPAHPHTATGGTATPATAGSPATRAAADASGPIATGLRR